MKRFIILAILILLAVDASASDKEIGSGTVLYPELIECYHWTRGCTPTAAAMALSYSDNRSASGLKYAYWGRLIDHYYSPDTWNNIPNLLDDLATDLGTNSSGGTPSDQIADGLRATITTRNRYDCTIRESGTGLSASFDFLKQEIDANRMCLFSTYPEDSYAGHSTTAWGYKRTLFNRWAVLYDTWDYAPIEPYYLNQREEWNMRFYYDGSGSTGPAWLQKVTSIQLHADPGSDDDISLDQPYGGEVIPAGRPYPIVWYQWGDRINNVEIQMSRNDGVSWTTIVQNLPSEGEGWHTYQWDVPCIDDDDVRIRIKAGHRAFLNFYVAGDGSFDQCRIQRVDPGVPGSTHASSTLVAPNESFTLSWTAVSGALSYEVSDNGTWSDVGSVTRVTRRHAGEGRHTYRVRAVGSCATSAANTATTVTVQIPLERPVLATVEDNVSADEPFVVRWDAVAGAVGYAIEVNGVWRDLDRTTHVTESQAAVGDYVYRLKVRGRYAESEPSEPRTVRVRSVCSVWPGDTNDDGRVDASDVLPLAQYWERSGPARDTIGYNWRAQPVDAWSEYAVTTADANGDGVVDMADLMALFVNWGRTHTAQTGSPALKTTGPAPDESILSLLYEQVSDAESGPQRELRLFLEQRLELPTQPRFLVHPNMPNPFNPSTTIRFEIPARSHVSVQVIDLTGAVVRRLANGILDPGAHEVIWHGRDEQGRAAPTGVYFYRVDAPGFTETRKMTLVK